MPKRASCDFCDLGVFFESKSLSSGIMVTEYLGDMAIMLDLVQRLAQTRLYLNLDQDVLAETTDVSNRTSGRLEAGQSVQLSNLIRVLAARGLARNIDLLIGKPGPRPMDLLRRKGKRRRRASIAAKTPAHPWSWNDK